MPLDLDLVPAAGAPAPLAPRGAPGPSPVAVYLQGHPAMRPSLLAVLRALGQPPEALPSFPWQALRFEHVTAIRAALVVAYAPATARKHLVAVRGVLETAWRMALLTREEFERAVDVESVKGDSEPAGRMLTPAEVGRLFGATSDDALGRRDRALLALAVYTGLRRHELSKLDLADVVGAEVTIVGKGKKRRNVFLPPAGREWIDGWLAVRGQTPGPLFWRAGRGGRPRAAVRLTPAGVWSVLTGISARAALDPPVTPHDFRRTFASTLLDRVDLATVQSLMGHASPSTTARYDRRGDERKKKAAAALAEAFEPKGGENT